MAITKKSGASTMSETAETARSNPRFTMDPGLPPTARYRGLLFSWRWLRSFDRGLSIGMAIVVVVRVVVVVAAGSLHLVHHGSEHVAPHPLERLLGVLHGRIRCLVGINHEDRGIGAGGENRGVGH